ncbi:arginyl aminopeptidase [Sphingobacteriales bacterium UPWRP_1]|nr:hypothetical protein BVG80_09350 [Sphingobacteriales bacterium TSM_CSM]PSJ78558.1 arginyl aminopeptidase [Sphingobacteriales bacterium UPWRP_1]
MYSPPMCNRLIYLLLLFVPAILPAQDLPYAKQVIDTLCSPYMAGRGYANQGDRKAANYIASQFTQWGAKPFGNDFFQHFNIDANVFPGNMEMRVNQKALIPGVDFVIHPASTGIEGTYKVLRIKEKWLVNDKKFDELLSKTYEGKALWLDYLPKNAKSLQGKLGMLQSAAKAAAYISPEDKKLTWHISGQPKYQTEITVLRKQLPRKFKTASFNIDNAYLSNYQTQNVVACIKGTQQPDSFFVFTAHYDHIGQMGNKQYVPGANDNAAGVAMLLNLMQHYAQNPPPFSVAFIAFGAEELGLLGSKYFTENPLFPLQNIKFLFNLDLVGTGDEGLMAVNATEFPDAFNLLQQLNTQYNYLPAIKSRPPAANSDQHWFYQNGVPCFFLYTMGGIQAYHDVFDRPETLPLTKFTNLCTLLTQFVQHYKK